MKIHPAADVNDSAEIGKGTFIWHQVQIREDVKIGENCVIGKNVYIDFGVTIGDNVKIQNNCSIYNGTEIASGVFVGPHVIFANDKVPRAINPNGSLKKSDDWQAGKIVVCYGASIGAGSVILPNVSIGKFALVGAGSVVTKDIGNYRLSYGSPATEKGYVCKCGKPLKSGRVCKTCKVTLKGNGRIVESN